MEKGLKKLLRPSLEISCHFWSPLGSLWPPEQHLCRKRHLQNLKPGGAWLDTDGLPGPGSAPANRFSPYFAWQMPRRRTNTVHRRYVLAGDTCDLGGKQPPLPRCASSSPACSSRDAVFIYGGPGEGYGGGMHRAPAARTARHVAQPRVPGAATAPPLLRREHTATGSLTARSDPPGLPQPSQSPAASMVPVPHWAPLPAGLAGSSAQLAAACPQSCNAAARVRRPCSSRNTKSRLNK